jgi:hypothetical protein
VIGELPHAEHDEHRAARDPAKESADRLSPVAGPWAGGAETARAVAAYSRCRIEATVMSTRAAAAVVRVTAVTWRLPGP